MYQLVPHKKEPTRRPRKDMTIRMMKRAMTIETCWSLRSINLERKAPSPSLRLLVNRQATLNWQQLWQIQMMIFHLLLNRQLNKIRRLLASSVMRMSTMMRKMNLRKRQLKSHSPRQNINNLRREDRSLMMKTMMMLVQNLSPRIPKVKAENLKAKRIRGKRR